MKLYDFRSCKWFINLSCVLIYMWNDGIVVGCYYFAILHVILLCLICDIIPLPCCSKYLSSFLAQFSILTIWLLTNLQPIKTLSLQHINIQTINNPLTFFKIIFRILRSLTLFKIYFTLTICLIVHLFIIIFLWLIILGNVFFLNL